MSYNWAAHQTWGSAGAAEAGAEAAAAGAGFAAAGRRRAAEGVGGGARVNLSDAEFARLMHRVVDDPRFDPGVLGGAHESGDDVSFGGYATAKGAGRVVGGVSGTAKAESVTVNRRPDGTFSTHVVNPQVDATAGAEATATMAGAAKAQGAASMAAAAGLMAISQLFGVMPGGGSSSDTRSPLRATRYNWPTLDEIAVSARVVHQADFPLAAEWAKSLSRMMNGVPQRPIANLGTLVDSAVVGGAAPRLGAAPGSGFGERHVMNCLFLLDLMVYSKELIAKGGDPLRAAFAAKIQEYRAGNAESYLPPGAVAMHALRLASKKRRELVVLANGQPLAAYDTCGAFMGWCALQPEEGNLPIGAAWTCMEVCSPGSRGCIQVNVPITTYGVRPTVKQVCIRPPKAADAVDLGFMETEVEIEACKVLIGKRATLAGFFQ